MFEQTEIFKNILTSDLKIRNPLNHEHEWSIPTFYIKVYLKPYDFKVYVALRMCKCGIHQILVPSWSKEIMYPLYEARWVFLDDSIIEGNPDDEGFETV